MFVGILIFGVLVSATAAQTEEFVEIAPYIVNGTDAMIEEFPFMVSIRRDGNHTCGGSLLSESWILTAAHSHCIYQSDFTKYIIEYGTTEISDGPNGTRIARAAEFIVHEDYDDFTIENDIGLVRLADPVVWNIEFRVRLPMQGQSFQTGTPALLAGWGRIGTGMPISSILQKVDLQIYSSFDCANIHAPGDILRTNICAGVEGGWKGQCSGDSGGPLLVNGVQVGVVSWSVKPCAIAPYPGVYTDVTHYIDWIQEKTVRMKSILAAVVILALLVASFVDAIPISPFVVNGTDAQIDEFPFIVSFKLINGIHNCGGSILNSMWVVTAAHCLTRPAENQTIQFDNTVVSSNGTNVIQVEKCIQHSAYDPQNTLINDIGLIKLMEPISSQFSEFRVRLPLSGAYYKTGTPSVLAGWGYNATGGIAQKTLQKVNLQIFSASDCNAIHSNKIHNTNICGGVLEGGKGQCSGDSGGPMLVDGVLVGIVSWSIKPCTIAPYPGVYTAVSHYIGWIKEMTGIDFTLNMFLLSQD
ncbi:unnamed protein product [Diamesa serratosioi]